MGDTCTALRDVLQHSRKRKPLLSSSSFQAVFTLLKHYIQPIMVLNGAAMLSGWGVVDEAQQALYTKVRRGRRGSSGHRSSRRSHSNHSVDQGSGNHVVDSNHGSKY